jgi:branched-chain amino acid transport system permease protein
MRAVRDDRALAQLNGARTALVARTSWAVGSSLAALGGVLIVSSAGLSATALSLLIVNAYAAAVFGRLRSIPMTFVGAIVLGLMEGYLIGYLPQNQYLPGLRLAAPVILLFIVLLLIPNPSLRSGVRTREYFPAPTRKGAAMFVVFTLAFGAVLATTLSRSDLTTYAKIFSIGIVALSLVPLVGFAGQISAVPAELRRHRRGDDGALRRGGSPMGVLVAVVVCAGRALWPCRALRLSGIYMAWPPPRSRCSSTAGCSTCRTSASGRSTSGSSAAARCR